MLHILKMYKHVVIFLIYEIINEIKEKKHEKCRNHDSSV